MPETQMDMQYLKSLLKNWCIDPSDVFPDAWIAGSPDRTLRRMVIVDTREKSFVLEEISPPAMGRKQDIAGIIDDLSRRGMKQVHPYCPDQRGDVVSGYDGRFWQLREYIRGCILPRPEYLEDAWRGEALAEFLIALHDTSEKALADTEGATFSIIRFIDGFMTKLRTYRPEVLRELNPLLDYLADEFYRVHDVLPRSFCHGDYHPLNVVWSEKEILSVIDWEFCGVKTEAYDLALLLGCLGMEDPRALIGPLIRSLMSCIRESGIYASDSLAVLPELVMALRFAWLSEWLRKNDVEMVCLELDYLSLLFHNQSTLKSAWRCL